jgi:ribosomal protein S6
MFSWWAWMIYLALGALLAWYLYRNAKRVVAARRAARKAEMEKLHGILKDQKLEVKNVNEWGVREFAYPIKKLTKGYYVIIKVAGEPEGLREFDRLAKLDNQVIRFLVTVDQD